jgi:hypothetical protein
LIEPKFINFIISLESAESGKNLNEDLDLVSNISAVFFSSDEESEVEDDEEVIDQEEAPIRLRRKRFVPRRDRAVNSLETALNSDNYALCPPPPRRVPVRQVF